MARCRWTACLGIAAMLMLAACGGNGEGGGSDAASGGDSAPPKPAEPVTLQFFHTSTGVSVDKFMDDYGNAIKKKFPHVTPVFTPLGKGNTIPELIAAGNTIDILWASIGHLHGNLLEYNLQYDMSELIKKSNFDLNRFEPTSIEMMRQSAKGGIYGLPIGNSSAALFYNKDLFDKFGVPYPKDGMTWDETYELAKRMTRQDGGKLYRGMTFSFQHMALLNQFSLPHIDPASGKATFSSDSKWAVFTDNFLRFNRIPGNEVDAKQMLLAYQSSAFFDEKISAMHATLSGGNPWASDNMGMIDVVTLPTFKELPGVGPQGYPYYFNITSMSKHKEQAFEVIAYLASDEFQMERSKKGFLSALKNPAVHQAFGQDSPSLQGKGLNLKALIPEKLARPALKTKYQSIADQRLMAGWYEMVQGKKDVNTGLGQAAETTDKAIEAQKGK
ncbi:ABC transporter substrate-binding protein [Paenibacillus oceani]|uniref:Extracellular solute-binding protein n=1 Tax=Paenibacillus oceani TaxID=2772510 RepID=A0A927H1G6_9BACL|nr:extracellular solute-binding protein [Paenibacillus oceani]MBD2864167.1 extracellular solute-binding protein [Paenibacillus oceani]